MANFGIIEFVLLETRKVEKSEPAQVQNHDSLPYVVRSRYVVGSDKSSRNFLRFLQSASHLDIIKRTIFLRLSQCKLN